MYKEVRQLLEMKSTIKSYLDDLLNSNYFWKEDYKFLKPCGGKPGMMCRWCKFISLILVQFLCTTISDVTPFWLILSAIGTWSSNLANIFVPVLKECTINEVVVHDSCSFCSKIWKQDLSLYITSFGIQPCYSRNVYVMLVLLNRVSVTLVLVVRVIHTLRNFLFKNQWKCS